MCGKASLTPKFPASFAALATRRRDRSSLSRSTSASCQTTFPSRLRRASRSDRLGKSRRPTRSKVSDEVSCSFRSSSADLYPLLGFSRFASSQTNPLSNSASLSSPHASRSAGFTLIRRGPRTSRSCSSLGRRSDRRSSSLSARLVPPAFNLLLVLRPGHIP